MRALLIVDLALTALGAAFTIAVGFVALVFVVYRHASTKMADGLPSVLALTACFVALTVLAGTASWLLRKRKPWHWGAQAALVLALPILWQIVYSNLRG